VKVNVTLSHITWKAAPQFRTRSKTPVRLHSCCIYALSGLSRYQTFLFEHSASRIYSRPTLRSAITSRSGLHA